MLHGQGIVVFSRGIIYVQGIGKLSVNYQWLICYPTTSSEAPGGENLGTATDFRFCDRLFHSLRRLYGPLKVLIDGGASARNGDVAGGNSVATKIAAGLCAGAIASAVRACCL